MVTWRMSGLELGTAVLPAGHAAAAEAGARVVTSTAGSPRAMAASAARSRRGARVGTMGDLSADHD